MRNTFFWSYQLRILIIMQGRCFRVKTFRYLIERTKKETENYFFKRNNYGNFCTVMPQGSTLSQFRQKWNVDFFAWKLVNCIYWGPRNKREIIVKKKKKLCLISYENAPRSDSLRILIRIQGRCFCVQTSGHRI